MSEVIREYRDDRFEITFTVSPEFEGKRLDQFMMEKFPTFSREFIKDKIKKGEVQISGRPHPHKPSVKVYEDEKIKVTTFPNDLEDEFWRGEKLEIKTNPTIIFEDENVIICSKPPYMSTHPSGKHLFNCATVYFEKLRKQPVHSLHRIDRETSGVLMLGKNPQTATSIGQKFENDEVRKGYFFISHVRKQNTFPFDAKERMGSIDTYIPRLYVHCYPENSAEGKEAHTHFEMILEKNGFLLGLAFPITGRQHQIRAHAAFHGFPLLGDKLYNGDPAVFMRFKDGIATEEDHELMMLPRHALHAVAVLIQYKDKPQLFIDHLPLDFIEWIRENLGLEIEDIEKQAQLRIKNYFKMI